MLSQINKSATRRALLKYYAVVLDVVSVAPTHLHSATAQSTLGRKKRVISSFRFLLWPMEALLGIERKKMKPLQIFLNTALLFFFYE